jgi:hypothetical protein
LIEFTMKAIEKKVDARYQSAAALIETLAWSFHSRDRWLSQGSRDRTVRQSAHSLRHRSHDDNRNTTPAPVVFGAFVIAIVALLLGGWVLARWWKPSPYKPSSVALDWYNKGTEALRNGAFLQASKALQQAVQNDKGVRVCSRARSSRGSVDRN